MSVVETSPPLAAPRALAEPVRYAGFWIRALALLIDDVAVTVVSMIAVFCITVPVMIVHPNLAADKSAIRASGNIGNLVVTVAYFIGLTASPWQATLGKRWLGIYVLTEDGRRLNPKHAFGRELAKFLSLITLMIGYMMAGWTREKTALHDRVAHTRVVYGRPRALLEAVSGDGRGAKTKAPGTALLWALAIPGAGQFYNRQWAKGVAFLLFIPSFWTIWLGWIPWIWSIANAYGTANRRFADNTDVSEVFA
jgi:uncharacterized RDD family membrane protein YckC